MNRMIWRPGALALGAAVWLFAGAQGCGSPAECDDCECDSANCWPATTTSTASSTETSTASSTETSTATPSSTDTPTATATSTETATATEELTPFEQICQMACDCMPDVCPTGDIAPCVADLQQAQQDALDAGCGAEIENLTSCYLEEVSCKNGELDLGGCQPVIDQMELCLEGDPDPDPDPDPGACQVVINQINAKFLSCGIAVEPEQVTECPQTLLLIYHCMNNCLQDASCAAINGEASPQETQAYSQCLMSCTS
jgi:hypothetical protein